MKEIQILIKKIINDGDVTPEIIGRKQGGYLWKNKRHYKE